LVLPRANDPTELLEADWGTRQATLKQLRDSGTLWSTHGATAKDYNNALQTPADLGIPVLGDASGNDGYVTSQESRTIWVQLTPENFRALFGKILYGAGPDLQY
jgi:hypothetical protein